MAIPEIRLHNPLLEAKPAETGDIKIVGNDLEDLLDIGYLDSATLHSAILLRVINGILTRLHMTWEGGARVWDPIEHNIGGAVFITNFWQEIV